LLAAHTPSSCNRRCLGRHSSRVCSNPLRPRADIQDTARSVAARVLFGQVINENQGRCSEILTERSNCVSRAASHCQRYISNIYVVGWSQRSNGAPRRTRSSRRGTALASNGFWSLWPMERCSMSERIRTLRNIITSVSSWLRSTAMLGSYPSSRTVNGCSSKHYFRAGERRRTI
jgi:hypothetical protein